MAPRIITLLALLSLGCSGASPSSRPSSTSAPTRAAERPVDRRALVIGIDGMRPDAMIAADAPHLDRIFAGGLFTLSGSTQLQGETSSGPGWASIMTGVDADQHGVLRNGMDGAIRIAEHPTFLARAHRDGHSIGVAAQDPRVLVMLEPGLRGESTGGSGDQVARAGASMIALDRELVFVVLEDVDHAGHATGFSADNPSYVAAVERVDEQIGRLLEAMRARRRFEDEQWLIVVVSDHGGEGHDHGAPTPANRTIPIAYASEELPTGELDERHRSQTFVAGAVLDWLAGESPFE